MEFNLANPLAVNPKRLMAVLRGAAREAQAEYVLAFLVIIIMTTGPNKDQLCFFVDIFGGPYNNDQ